MGDRRYPGALPFNSKQEKIFYGRDRDINKLLTLIKVEKQVLLYSKSGLGKTSLLQAGVLPKLPEEYIPISIRFFGYIPNSPSPIERVIEAVKNIQPEFEKLSDTVVDLLIEDKDSHKNLWYYFKKLDFAVNRNNKGKRKTFVLVFDQFEELFDYPQDQFVEFKKQFYELTRMFVPGTISRLIGEERKKRPKVIDQDIIAQLYESVNIKSVFAIRSDRLSLLNRMSDRFPNIQKNYKVIYPLDAQQARDAIINPAIDPDKNFEVQPFEYDAKAVDKIISELTEKGSQKLESTQLQIVCQEIEEIAAKKQDNITGSDKVLIKEKDLPEFKNIFLNFYERSIGKVAKSQQDSAKRLIEDELIRNQQRLSLDENICKDFIDEKALETLVSTGEILQSI